MHLKQKQTIKSDNNSNNEIKINYDYNINYYNGAFQYLFEKNKENSHLYLEVNYKGLMGVIQQGRFMIAVPRNFHLGWFQRKITFGKQ